MTRPASPWRPTGTARRVPRPPTWLLALGWALAGLGWLAYPSGFAFVAQGVFVALMLWWARWLASKDRP
jgi:hypothetical protein